MNPIKKLFKQESAVIAKLPEQYVDTHMVFTHSNGETTMYRVTGTGLVTGNVICSPVAAIERSAEIPVTDLRPATRTEVAATVAKKIAGKLTYKFSKHDVLDFFNRHVTYDRPGFKINAVYETSTDSIHVRAEYTDPVTGKETVEESQEVPPYLQGEQQCLYVVGKLLKDIESNLRVAQLKVDGRPSSDFGYAGDDSLHGLNSLFKQYYTPPKYLVPVQNLFAQLPTSHQVANQQNVAQANQQLYSDLGAAAVKITEDQEDDT